MRILGINPLKPKLIYTRDQLEKNPSHKINFLNTIKNFTPSKNDTTSEKDTSMMDTPSSKIEPSVNSQQQTPKETTTNKRTQISPFRREFLRRNFIETQQKTIQIKAPDQTIDNLTPLSVCTPQQSKVKVIDTLFMNFIFSFRSQCLQKLNLLPEMTVLIFLMNPIKKDNEVYSFYIKFYPYLKRKASFKFSRE